MSDDALKRARQMLQGATKPGAPAATGRSKVDDLLARARAAAGHEPEPVGKVHAAQPPVGAAKVRLPMTCGATGRPFIAIAERRGAELRLVDHELPPPDHHRSGSGAHAERLSGEYRVRHADSWACPHCRSREPGWSCSGCPEYPDAFHCGGSQGRRRYCACGKLESREFEEVEVLSVRGQSVGRRANTNATPSLSSRGRLALPGKR
jgi:hypothetical protein